MGGVRDEGGANMHSVCLLYILLDIGYLTSNVLFSIANRLVLHGLLTNTPSRQHYPGHC